MNRVKEFFNGYINLFLFFLILTALVVSAFSKSSVIFFDWVLIFIMFLSNVSTEKTRDLQHEIIINQELQINFLEDEVRRLKEGK